MESVLNCFTIVIVKIQKLVCHSSMRKTHISECSEFIAQRRSTWMPVLKGTILTVTATYFMNITSANAAIQVEPFAGYQVQKLKITDLADTKTEVKTDGSVFGARLGLRSPIGISLDLYGSYSNGKAIYTPAVTQPAKYTHTVGAAQLGVSAMKVMKIYLGYIFSNTYRLESNSVVPEQKLSGGGYQAGLGLFLTQSVSLMANYNVHQFTKIKGETFQIGDEVDLYYKSVDLTDASIALSYTF